MDDTVAHFKEGTKMPQQPVLVDYGIFPGNKVGNTLGPVTVRTAIGNVKFTDGFLIRHTTPFFGGGKPDDWNQIVYWSIGGYQYETITFPVPVKSVTLYEYNSSPGQNFIHLIDDKGNDLHYTNPGISLFVPAPHEITFNSMSPEGMKYLRIYGAGAFSINNVSIDPLLVHNLDNAKDPSIVTRDATLAVASDVLLFVGAVAAPETLGVSFVLSAALAGLATGYTLRVFRDPPDDEYGSEFSPVFVSLPQLAADGSTPQRVIDDANAALVDGGDAVSYLQAVFVTTNRLGSAEAAGDQTSVALQKNALSNFMSGASSELLQYADDLQTLSRDIATEHLDASVSYESVSAFLDGINGAYSSLPAQARDLFTAFNVDTETIQMYLNELSATDVSQMPSSITEALAASADAVIGLANAYAAPAVACFREGTLILTENDHLVAVEALSAGIHVSTLYGLVKSIKWIGSRTVSCRRHPEPEKVWPVQVRAGAFGDGLPLRDLWLSPDHAVFVDGVLIPIKRLINGTSIAQVPMDEVTYYHVELAEHDVLLAEGLPCESYLDTGDRSNFENGGTVMRLFPDFSPPLCDAALVWETKGCAPLVIHGPELEAARAAINARAPALSAVQPVTMTA